MKKNIVNLFMLFALLAMIQNVSIAQTDSTDTASEVSIDETEDYGIDSSDEESSIAEEPTEESFE